METTILMTIPARTLAQLSAVAGTADRANRPTHLVALGALALFAGLVFALSSYKSLSGAQSAIARAQSDTQRIDHQIALYHSLQVEETSLATYYPADPYIDTAIEGVIDPYRDEFERPPDIAPSPDRKDISGVPGLEQYELRCSARNDPIQLTSRWISDALAEQEHCADRVFVSHISLSPVPSNQFWNTTFKLAWYVAK